MTTIASRVAARYERQTSRRWAKAIGGDFKATLLKWKVQLDEYIELEPELPRIIREEAAAAALEVRPPLLFEKDKIYPSYYIDFPSYSHRVFKRLGVADLLLGILQQYELAPAARLKVEDAARFYAQRSVRSPRTLKTAIPVFTKLLEFYREQYEVAHKIIQEGKLRGTEDDVPGVLMAGPFKVVNTGGFEQDIMLRVADVVKDAARLLKAKGLGKVCYGEILVSNQVHKANTAAFYLLDHDEMFVRADLKGHEAYALHYVIHELGHRLQFKFLEGKKRQIALMYGRLKRGREAEEKAAIEVITNDPANYPKDGDEWVDSLGTKYRVFEFKPESRSRTVTVRAENDSRDYRRFDLWDYLQLQGHKLPPLHAPTFITAYARKNANENFAEMIAYYCMDKLPEQQVEMLLPILG